MPELPEVEVVRASLAPRLVGRRVERVAVHRPDLREPLDAAALRGLAGREVRALRRRAKYLLVDLEGDRTLVVHLGMSGRLTLVPASTPRDLHEHVGIGVGGDRLRFVDPRRFGLVLVLPTGEVAADRHFRDLGPEPLEDGFDGTVLARRARGRRGPVKPFLMDARTVVGIGNIYASEVLFAAGVHPRRSVGRIGAGRWERVAGAAREVLAAAVGAGGTTLSDFVDAEGRAGSNQLRLGVYDRAGEPCPRCGRAIRRLVQAGRSTFYCPGCQR